MTIEELQWDSDFFGVKAGRCLLKDNDRWEEEKLDQWDLIYFFINPKDHLANQRMEKSSIKLVDEKVTFVMNLLRLHKGDQEIERVYSYTGDDKLNDVVRIGIQSGIYSRFSLDTHIAKNKFEELYKTWMFRSVSRELAREVFVYKTINDVIAGVITLGNKGARSDIGIIAVDEKFRGLQIGKKLVAAAIQNSKDAGYEMLQVVTQKANEAACRFYEQCGFSEEQIIKIYHYWRKP